MSSLTAHANARPAPALLGDADAVAAMLDKSGRSVRRLNAAALLPKPVKVGGSIRWRLAEIAAWVEADCPPRKAWESMRKTWDAAQKS